MRKVCMARGHLPHGSMVGWFMPFDTTLPHGFLERGFLVVQVGLVVILPVDKDLLLLGAPNIQTSVAFNTFSK